MKLHAYKWNKLDCTINTMLILTEEDIINESNEWCGSGYEILILPSKYKEVNSEYLDNVRMIAICRNGEVIYV